MLQRRLTLPAAGIALGLSFVLIGLGIWAGTMIVSVLSSQLIEQVTEMVRREVDDIIAFGNRVSTRIVNDLARNDISLSDPVALRRELGCDAGAVEALADRLTRAGQQAPRRSSKGSRSCSGRCRTARRSGSARWSSRGRQTCAISGGHKH